MKKGNFFICGLTLICVTFLLKLIPSFIDYILIYGIILIIIGGLISKQDSLS